METDIDTIISHLSTKPQVRLLQQAAAILREGGVIAYPTDSGYALGCRLGDKNAGANKEHTPFIRRA